MGFVLGFLPWVLYWALIGNVGFRAVVLIVLAVAVVTHVVQRVRGEPRRSLETGSLVVFVVLAIAAFVFDDGFLEQWMQPLSNLGIFLVALVGVLIGRPFVREYATASVDEATARSDGFRVITTGMTWLWVAVFAAMTLVSSIPPIVDGAATIRDDGGALSIVCYWVLPYLLLAVGGLVSGLFPPWFEKRSARVERRESDEAPHVVAQRDPAPDETTSGLRLDVPDRSRPDEPFRVAVHGAPPGSAVDLTVTGDDLYGRTWRSAARLTAGSTGAADTGIDAPASGEWDAAAPAVPLTSLRFATPGVTPDLFVPPAEPWLVTVTAESDGAGSARRTVRRAPAEGLRRSTFDDGLLALPPGEAPRGGWPAVACFGGSEGGHASQIGAAETLAGLGFAALAAEWVPEGQPVSRVPLERFTDTLTRLAAHDEVDDGRVAAMAVSRGAEGLLAAVCTAPSTPCRGLVLVSPSAVTWQAIGDDGEIPDTPSWTRNGEPVDWRPLHSGVLMPQLIRNAWRVGADTAAHRPTLLRLRPVYEDGLARGGPGVIAAENVRCPLLLITGSDDEVWPSADMARSLLSRRAGGDTHVDHPGAGHLTRLGALPTDALWTGGIALGGTRSGQAAADRDATERVPAFLREVCGVSAPAPT